MDYSKSDLEIKKKLYNLVYRLENAINCQDVTEAGNLATMLAQLKVDVIIESVPETQEEICLQVEIINKGSVQFFEIQVLLSTTIYLLKLMVWRNYLYLTSSQKWCFDDLLASDHLPLSHYLTLHTANKINNDHNENNNKGHNNNNNNNKDHNINKNNKDHNNNNNKDHNINNNNDNEDHNDKMFSDANNISTETKNLKNQQDDQHSHNNNNNTTQTNNKDTKIAPIRSLKAVVYIMEAYSRRDGDDDDANEMLHKH